MTGSSTKPTTSSTIQHAASPAIEHAASPAIEHAASPAIEHAASPQWTRLVEAVERQSVLLKSQPEVWWRTHAEQLSTKWLASGLPTTRREEWKYTSLVPLHGGDRTIGLGPVDVTAPEGVRVLRLSQLKSDTSISPIDQQAYRTLLETSGDVFFENLAKSLVSDPFLIFIPNGFTSTQPIEIFWRGLPAGQWGVGVAAIIADTRSNISLIERYGNGVDAQAIATFFEVRANARVSHLRIQEGGNTPDVGVVLASSRVSILASASYEVSQISFGSRLSREDSTIELCEELAEAVVDGVFIGRADQVLDHHTNLVHRVGATKSRQIYKGILSDQSRGVFNGRIAIAKYASGANSSQLNKNLLLSKNVELDTKPQLEIDCDDVKAAHGAAIGRLDADHIFYLRSRGIEMNQAVEMLARGFAFEAIERLSSESLRTLGRSEIEKGLTGLSWEGR